MDQQILAAFKQTKHQLSGHGFRTARVLQEAFRHIDAGLESDMYGKGEVIESFQQKMAAYLGKEAAVFFPSGAMAQQIALRIWCDEKGIKTVAYHPLCHLEIHEEDGLKELHGIQSLLLADRDRVITLEDVTGLSEEIACLLLELPQREIGGQLPDYKTLEAISAHCRENGIYLHLDGARLFEILPYYEKTAAEVCALFDSVYVSVYKGVGGIAGAILAGSADFTEKSKVWKRRHGGDLISLYPYIISADAYFEQRIGSMPCYYEGAKELAGLFNRCCHIATKPEVPVSNMFHVHFAVSKEQLAPLFVRIYETTGIGLTGHLRETETGCYCEISVGDLYINMPKAELRQAFDVLQAELQAL